MKYIGSAVRNYLVLITLYLLLGLLLPASSVDMQNYGLSAREYHVLRFVLALPLALVWFTAFYGYARLKEYAAVMDNTAESRGFQQLARGVHWLAWGLALPSVLSLVLNNGIANAHPNLHEAAVISINYITLALTLVGLVITSNATHELALRSKRTFSAASARSLQFIFVTSGVLYCYLTFRHVDMQSLASTNNAYFLPVWLLIMTIIIPSLYAWFVGLLAAYDITLMAKQTHGLLYRHALRNLAAGLVVVIASYVAQQYLHTVVPRTGHLSLNTTLLLTYSIYICTMLGFVLMTVGAIRLKRIEEV